MWVYSSIFSCNVNWEINRSTIIIDKRKWVNASRIWTMKLTDLFFYWVYGWIFNFLICLFDWRKRVRYYRSILSLYLLFGFCFLSSPHFYKTLNRKKNMYCLKWIVWFIEKKKKWESNGILLFSERRLFEQYR